MVGPGVVFHQTLAADRVLVERDNQVAAVKVEISDGSVPHPEVRGHPRNRFPVNHAQPFVGTALVPIEIE